MFSTKLFFTLCQRHVMSLQMWAITLLAKKVERHQTQCCTANNQYCYNVNDIDITAACFKMYFYFDIHSQFSLTMSGWTWQQLY